MTSLPNTHEFVPPKSIRVVSDGTVRGTEIFDQNGRQIGLIKRCVIDINSDAKSGVPGVLAKLEVYFPRLELNNLAVSDIKRIPLPDEKPNDTKGVIDGRETKESV